MATTALKGNPVQLTGELPAIGSKAPDFLLTKNDLSDVTLKDFAGKKIVLNIFPSIDTAVCAASVRKFNQAFDKRTDAVVLCVSMDLPFAQARFCGAEGLNNVITVSDFRSPSFGSAYGVLIADGPLAGLCARAVVAIGPDGTVIYTQLVNEITTEPDYESALKAIG
ncbi:MAG: thiol peroxidase [Deltaproteobacteria bacterium]|nr:thiol peroxidase [Deltaproteobacteria bacterium]